MSNVKLERLKANAHFLATAPGGPAFLKSAASKNLSINLQVEPAGWKNLVLESGGFLYRYHRVNDPFSEWSEKLDPGNQGGLLVCLGTGFGYQLHKLMKKLGGADGLIIVESYPEALFLLLTELDLVDILPPDVRIVFAPKPEHLFEFLQTRLARYRKTPIQLLPLDSFGILSPGYLESLVEALEDFSARHNVYIKSLEEQADIIFENVLRNLSSLANSHKAKEGCARGERSLIVASGPSTNWNMPYIKAVGEFAHIVAVGSAIEPLLKNDIEPDFVVVSDPNPINRIHFPREKYASTLIYDLVVPPEIINKFKGSRIVCNVGHGIENLIFEKQPVLRLSGWGTVASIALDFCVKAGFYEIALVGTDYSYLGDRSHVDDYCSDFTPARELKVKDIHGRSVRTTKSFSDYAAYIEKQIEGYNLRDKRIYNCCEGGLVRAGHHLTLREYLQRSYQDDRSKGQLRDFQPIRLDSKQIDSTIRFIRAKIQESVDTLDKNVGVTMNLNEWAKLPAVYAFEGLLLGELKTLENDIISGDETAIQQAKRNITERLERLGGILTDRIRNTVGS